MPIVYLSLLVTLFLIHGCATYGVSKVSEPELIENEKGYATLENDILAYRDITISVKPQNYYVSFFAISPIVPIFPFPTTGDPPVKRKKEQLILLIQMETESEGYEFSPALVRLRFNNEEFKPVSARGPYPGGGNTQQVEKTIPGHKWRCSTPAIEPLSSFEPRKIKGRACFEIEFPILTIPPEKSFRVTLGGIEKNGEPFPVAIFQFHPASRSGFSFEIEK